MKRCKRKKEVRNVSAMRDIIMSSDIKGEEQDAKLKSK
jgi:hypothetical protein